jgi:hypothetical protein
VKSWKAYVACGVLFDDCEVELSIAVRGASTETSGTLREVGHHELSRRWVRWVGVAYKHKEVINLSMNAFESANESYQGSWAPQSGQRSDQFQTAQRQS